MKIYVKNWWTIKKCVGEYTSNMINSNFIKQYLEVNGFTELILKTTEECNLRCKYCIYSEHYSYTVTYSFNKMEFEVAKKAVDLYLHKVLKQKNFYNINRTPCIAFYGGEPLLNFSLIEKVIKYIKEIYPQLECVYTITTNGLLLRDKVISDFLKENNVVICLSLDGYKENHDRNRLTYNNNPTYDEIINKY